MFRQTVLPLCLLAALAFGTTAHAGDHPIPPPHGDSDAQKHQDAQMDQDDDSDDADGPDGDDTPDARRAPVPIAGYDVGYDYVIAHDHVDVDPYYNYQGPPPTDPRSREQTGLRDGLLPITPRTPYYAGVHIYGADYGYGYGYGSDGYGYGRGYGYNACGCAHYRRRYNVYVDDYGNRGDSYSGYDHRRGEDYGRGYGDR